MAWSDRKLVCLCSAGNSPDDGADRAAAPLDFGPVRVVHVQRRADIEAVRAGLPITGMEQEVMEALIHSDVVVLCGETGCGKTTQVCPLRHTNTHILHACSYMMLVSCLLAAIPHPKCQVGSDAGTSPAVFGSPPVVQMKCKYDQILHCMHDTRQ